MATRFSLYQNSFKKFIVNQSVLVNNNYKDQIIKLLDGSDFILPISLLTIMNGQQKKNKLKLAHGYEMATGIELLIVLMNLLKEKKTIDVQNPSNLNNNIRDSLCSSLSSIINITFSRNIEAVAQYHDPSNIVKIYTTGLEQINSKICKIVNAIMSIDFDCTKIQDKTDLTKFHFKNSIIIDKIKKLKYLPKDFVTKYTVDTYGNICKLALILGWIIGGSSPDMINNLDRLGHHLCFLIKIAYDFENLDNDAELYSKNKYTLNYVLNFGIQDSFELFDESKKKFNEGLLTLEITSPTIKEFVDILEEKVNSALDRSSPDIKKSSTS